MDGSIFHGSGIAKGATMTDAEVLRFYNGIVAALSGAPHDLSFIHTMANAQSARNRLGHAMDVLHGAGMVATIGHAGTAIIRAAQAVEVAA